MNGAVEVSSHQGGPLNGQPGNVDAWVMSIGKNCGAENRGGAADRPMLWELADVLDRLEPLGPHWRWGHVWSGVVVVCERRVWHREGPGECWLTNLWRRRFCASTGDSSVMSSWVVANIGVKLFLSLFWKCYHGCK